MRQQTKFRVALCLPSDLRLVGMLLFLIACCFLVSCYEDDLIVSVGNDVPPVFQLSGSGNLVFFIVEEVVPENQQGSAFAGDSKKVVIWKISPEGLSSDARVARRLPAITYGKVPLGFIQKIPQEGSPPELVEGKVYEAGGPATNANGGFIRFKVERGKIVKD